MGVNYTEIRVSGKAIKVPWIRINDRTIVVKGKWLKMAAVQDEELVEGEVVGNPESFVRALEADIFTFAQHLTENIPKYHYYLEWDNTAVISTSSFADWWEKRVSHGLRKDVKRARKRGVVVRAVEFNDEFVRGIAGIYNETPIRQGRPFWHYGKSFDSVKAEISTYLERSAFLGAYCNDELIGFLKIVYVGQIARLMFILSKRAHNDKRPTNALIAKAVELCERRKCLYLTYGHFSYADNAETSLAAFKHRNGFYQISFPRYFIPLTLKGKVCLKLGLHHGINKMVPNKVRNLARSARKKIYENIVARLRSDSQPPSLGQDAQATNTLE
jgi:hypothetical protein